MNEKVKIGLLAVIAVALIANAYFLMTDRGAYVDPTESKATFERTSNNNATASTTNLDAGQARQKAMDAAGAIDPLNATRTAASSTAMTTMSFDNNAHDFGSIKQDTEHKKIFTFTNTGSEPLIIENAKGSCGCTVPKYPKEPIAPGATGEIEVVYKPGKQKNKQTKNVTITANTSPANTVLTITADVQEIAS